MLFLNKYRLYNSVEAAKKLNIGFSTLRKWCLALEKNGYKIKRGAKRGRIFDEKDLFLLDELKHLIKEKHFNLNDSVEFLLKNVKSEEDKNDLEEIEIISELKKINQTLQKIYEHMIESKKRG